MLGRLLNEYLVDMFSSVEDSRLNYIRHEVQNWITARSKLDETIEAEGGVCAGRVYLPASFMGSPRMQRKLIADSLAIVRRYGKPTYFLMVTCNPNWPEIRNHPGMNGQGASDCPDMTCRVFHQKLKKILMSCDRVYCAARSTCFTLWNFRRAAWLMPISPYAWSLSPKRLTISIK